VGREILQGLVTPAGARSYGVVADEDGVVDEAATEALRASLRAARPQVVPLFNYGPAIEDLRAASEVETGLPAPVQPRWTTPVLPLAAE
jgi:N-methylhydantoinase B